jgi:alkanesulfonate monooxygenase SsuD/methylene tetrahydromethanopterin reductase-like flavin-dependent oxidoreductase (luciferase family)
VSLRLGLFFSGQLPLDGSRSAGDEYQIIIDLAGEGERLGFESVWLTEHHFAADSYLPTIFPLLGAIAARTTTIKLGAGVILAPFNNPIRVAEDAAVVDLLSGGRLLLGMGLGWRGEEFRVFNVPRRKRVAHLEDALAVVWTALKGERFSYSGPTIQVEDCRIMPSPGRAIPIWLGASADPGLERVGAVADAYISGFTSAQNFAHRLAVVDEAARAAGRPVPMPVAAMIDCWPGTPDARVLAGAWAATDIYRRWHAGDDTAESVLTMPDHEPGDAPPLLQHGDPDDIAAGLGQFVDAARGRDFLICLRFAFPGVDPDLTRDAMRTFAADVMPRLTSAWEPTSGAGRA